MARRLKAMGLDKYKNGFKLSLHEGALSIPSTWRGSKIVFVNSMSDLFHKDIPLDFIKKVFRVMNENPQHTFQVLTKRSDILLHFDKKLTWSPNIWMGVSVENEKECHRVDDLRRTSAYIKFLSCEPLLGPLPDLDLKNIDWVIVGGESGRKPREMHPSWVVDIKKQCIKNKVAFFFKQWGGTNKKRSGRLLNGRTYDGMPKTNTLRPRQITQIA
jgi:protein gp37